MLSLILFFHFNFLAGLIITTIPVNSDKQIPLNSTESFEPTSTKMTDVQRSGVKNNTFGINCNT